MEEKQLILFAGDSPARTSQLPEDARALLETDRDFTSSLRELLSNLARDGLLLKMSPVFYPRTEDATSRPSFEGWGSSGIAFPGGYLILNSSESPRDGSESSLSEVLETDPPRRYFLSPRACRGILRRAAKKGKAIPPDLERALRMIAEE